MDAPQTATNRRKPRGRPTRETCALLLVDVVNDLEFEGGANLLRYARALAPRLARLIERARAAGVPVIYANDNFGRWRSDFRSQVRRCLKAGVRGREIVRQLAPRPGDYFVLKPKHSAFYATPLEVLLTTLSVRRLVIAGMAGNNCVLFTAHDAYMREYELVVPSDTIASETAKDNRIALTHLERVLKADTTLSSRVALRVR